MYNPQTSIQAGRVPGKTPKEQDVFAEERIGNEQIRELLRTFGLRTSLIRLKVIDALLVAAQSERRLGVRGVHSQLLDLDIPLSFLSVREVLKRLCVEGVISLGSDKCYSLNPEARAVLEEIIAKADPEAVNGFGCVAVGYLGKRGDQAFAVGAAGRERVLLPLRVGRVVVAAQPPVRHLPPRGGVVTEGVDLDPALNAKRGDDAPQYDHASFRRRPTSIRQQPWRLA